MDATKAKPKRGAAPKYPWDRWMDGRKRVIEQGRHFQCSLRSMTVYLYQVAKRRKLSVSVIDLGAGKLSIQAAN